MHVAEIWRYPVKSMIGETVDRGELDASGVVGDRRWATRDLQRGGIRGAKQIGQLMRFTATATGDVGDTVVITAPDGATFRSDQPDIDDRLSAALDHPVLLQHLRPADDLDHYRRGPSDNADPVASLRAVFGREDDEPLPDFSIFPPIIMEFESPPGSYVDVFPLMIMSTSALRSLQQAVPDAVVDVRRFRPSLVIDTGDEPGHPEFAWTGRQLRVGDAVLDILDPCPRCVMVTREIDEDVPQDRTILRHIVRDLGQHVGVYASVATPGPVHAGACVELLEKAASPA